MLGETGIMWNKAGNLQKGGGGLSWRVGVGGPRTGSFEMAEKDSVFPPSPRWLKVFLSREFSY